MSAPTAESDDTRDQHVEDTFLAEASRIRSVVGRQRLLSQSRCVDHVLDLLNLTGDRAVRGELTAYLAGIRKLTAVEGDGFRRLLDETVMAVRVEDALRSASLA